MNGIAVPSGNICQRRADVQRFWPRARQPIRGEQPDQHDRGEHRHEYAHADGDGKAADGSGAEHKQDQHFDQRGRVRIEYCAIGLAETGLDGRDHAAGLARLFARAFVDEDVGVDSHAERQQNARHAGKRQGGAQQRQPSKGERQIGDESDSGKAAEDPVDRQDKRRP